MEQRLDTTYLAGDYLERSVAFAVRAVFLGLGVFLAAWGISFFWRVAPEPTKLNLTLPSLQAASEGQKNPLQPPPSVSMPAQTQSDKETVLRREVTVFTHVSHIPGTVVTGWSYKDGAGGRPTRQFCYYTSASPDQTSTRVDLAFDRTPVPSINRSAVPNPDQAISKCQWLDW
jgi:hypothetical protein